MKNKIVVVFCCLVMLAALVSIWRRLNPPMTQISKQEVRGVQTGLGQVLSEETVKVVPDRGHIVVVTTLTPEQLKDQFSYVWETFESEMQKHNIAIAFEKVAFNAWSSGSLEDAANFHAVLHRQKQADALVFFTDLLEWGRATEGFSWDGIPKIIAMDTFGQQMEPRYKGYFSNKVLVSLIGRKMQPVPSTRPETPREWFDRNFLVYTPQNYETLLATPVPGPH